MADTTDTTGVNDETERPMMQRHGVFRCLTSFRDDQRGTIAIIVSLLSMVLVGFAALAVDGGHLYWTRTQLQGAADAAALAGVVAIPTNTGTLDTTEQNTILGQARIYAQKNMSLANNGNIVATSDVKPGHWDPDTRTFYALGSIPTGKEADAVKVIARRAAVNGNALGLSFAAVIGFRQTDVTAKAIAYAGAGGGDQACILALNPSDPASISMSGTNTLDLDDCGIAMHSTAAEDLVISGTTDISVGPVCMAGDPGLLEGGTVTWDPNPPDLQPGCDPPDDPLASLAPPPVGPCPSFDPAFNNLVISSPTTKILSPGTYCGGIELAGANMDIDFLPGIYVLKGGGLIVSGSDSTFDGTGIMFYNTDDGFGSYGDIDFSGSNDIINFTASTTEDDAYAGILFFGDRTSAPGDFKWKIAGGTNAVNMDGVVYMPTQHVEFSGDSAIGGSCGVKIISRTVTLNGSNIAFPTPGNDCASDAVDILLGGTEFVLVD